MVDNGGTIFEEDLVKFRYSRVSNITPKEMRERAKEIKKHISELKQWELLNVIEDMADNVIELVDYLAPPLYQFLNLKQ